MLGSTLLLALFILWIVLIAAVHHFEMLSCGLVLSTLLSLSRGKAHCSSLLAVLCYRLSSSLWCLAMTFETVLWCGVRADGHISILTYPTQFIASTLSLSLMEKPPPPHYYLQSYNAVGSVTMTARDNLLHCLPDELIIGTLVFLDVKTLCQKHQLYTLYQ